MKESRMPLKVLTDKPTGKRSLGKHTRRYKAYIRMYIKGIGVNTRK